MSNRVSRIVLGAALSSALIAVPAAAQESGFYIGGELGAVISADSEQEYTPGATPGTTGSVSTDHELGFSGAAFAGYDFGMIRVEAEAGYQSSRVDKVNSSFAAGAGTLAAGSQSASGDVTAQSVLLNGIWDAGEFEGVSFFFGGGAGAAKVKVSDLTTAGGATLLDDKSEDWLFAWQAIAGVRKSLSDNVDVHVRYRYLNVDETELTGLSGRAVTADFSSHALAAGLTFRF
ncbi:MAG: hypothetical protein B7X53_05765 [Hyphomonas sp. 34-62-18]|nr:outer membrane beta-barrel protein [Hyphomonas sp. 34-62-18]OZB17606.1 MAG: hypothetical protein B7X53_05765 [Hyphomonas sp. 34-62-18]